VLNRLYLENNEEIMMEPREKYVNVFFTREELTSNEDGKKFYGDIKNCMDTAFKEGKEAGKKEGLKQGKKAMIVEIIQNGVSNNISVEILTQLTGLTEKEVLSIISTL
jgi:predicted transposase/invertase (TIGR01784 family)